MIPTAAKRAGSTSTVPHDLFDYDSINELVLLDLDFEGQPRKVLVRPERNGYIYVIDRATGQVLAADPYAIVNSTLGVDLKTGALHYNDEKKPRVGQVIRNICPTAPGAKDWKPSAYSPRTGLLYIPHMNLCMDWQSIEANYIAGTPYIGANVKMYAGPGGNRGVFTAWDSKKRKQSLGAEGRPPRCGAVRWPRRATLSFTALWTAGSKHSMPARAS